jgi:glycosyltransferase involved in cell wall biosynthesis
LIKLDEIFYFTPIASPFQLEFVDGCNQELAKLRKEKMLPVFLRPLPAHRKHWGQTGLGINLYESKKSRIHRTWSLLEERHPKACILTSYTSIDNWIARFWCLSRKRKFFIGPAEPMNTYAAGFLRHSFRLSLFKQFVNRASGLAAMGNNALRMYRKVYKGKMINCSYTFDQTELQSKSQLSLDAPLTFLYSGRLSPFRNPLLVIEAFAEVHQSFPDLPVKLIMSGKGELYHECTQKIKDRAVEEHVTWINDFKDWHDIHKLYEKAHVLLALQHYSTWGLIIQEAMAAGMSIVATRTIESADNLIIDGYNGYLISASKEEAVKAMSTYALDKTLVELHGKRSRHIAKTVDLKTQSEIFITNFFS